MTETQQQQADDLIEAFEMFDDWEDKYRFLIDLGRKLPALPESEKTEENRIHGCQSRVWVVAEKRSAPEGDVVEFVADSDSDIVKGLISILRRVYYGQTAERILQFDIEGLLHQLELDQHLSMNRRNGLYEMIQRIKRLALTLQTDSARPLEATE
jgi:sulfur transfer protein SufE